jgi:hypothetical protein
MRVVVRLIIARVVYLCAREPSNVLSISPLELGPFIAFRELGCDGSGVVYEARRKDESEDTFALKVEAATGSSFEAEAARLARIDIRRWCAFIAPASCRMVVPTSRWSSGSSSQCRRPMC